MGLILQMDNQRLILFVYTWVEAVLGCTIQLLDFDTFTMVFVKQQDDGRQLLIVGFRCLSSFLVDATQFSNERLVGDAPAVGIL